MLLQCSISYLDNNEHIWFVLLLLILLLNILHHSHV